MIDVTNISSVELKTPPSFACPHLHSLSQPPASATIHLSLIPASPTRILFHSFSFSEFSIIFFPYFCPVAWNMFKHLWLVLSLVLGISSVSALFKKESWELPRYHLSLPLSFSCLFYFLLKVPMTAMAWPGNCLPASSLASPCCSPQLTVWPKIPLPSPHSPTSYWSPPSPLLLSDETVFPSCCFSELLSVFGYFTFGSLSVRGNRGGRGGEASRTHQWSEGWASPLSPHSSPQDASLLTCGLCPANQRTAVQDCQAWSLQVEVALKVSHPGQQCCASMPCRQHCGGGGLTRLPWPAWACPGSQLPASFGSFVFSEPGFPLLTHCERAHIPWADIPSINSFSA